MFSSPRGWILAGIAVQSGRHQVDVGIVFFNTVGTHTQDGHIGAEHHVLGAGMLQNLGDGVFAAVGAEVVHQIGDLIQGIESITHVIGSISAADMGNDQFYIGEFPLKFQDLCQVDRILQTAMAGNVQHGDGAHAIQHFQVILGEEVENTDLSFGQVHRGTVQVTLDTQETAFTNVLFQICGRLGRIGIVQGRPAGLAGALRNICVVLLPAAAAGEHQSLHILAGEHEPVSLLQVFDGVIQRHQGGPGNGALYKAGLRRLLLQELIQPYMGMYVQNLVRQKILQFFFVNFLVVSGYFKQCHENSLPFRINPSLRRQRYP